MRVLLTTLAAIALTITGSACATTPPAPPEAPANLWQRVDASLYGRDSANPTLAMIEYQIESGLADGTLTGHPLCISTSNDLSEETIPDTDFERLRTRYPFLAPIETCIQFQISTQSSVVRAGKTVLMVNSRTISSGDQVLRTKFRFREGRDAWFVYDGIFDELWWFTEQVPIEISEASGGPSGSAS